MSVYQYSEACGDTADATPGQPDAGAPLAFDDGFPRPRANYRGFLPHDVRGNLRSLACSGAGANQIQPHSRRKGHPLAWIVGGAVLIWWLNQKR